MIQTARRLDTVQEYYFATKLREVRQMVTAGHSIINAGIGSPDLAPPSQVIEALTHALQDENAHGYQSYLGLPQLRQAMAHFYKDHYKVTINADSEVIPLMGSKEGILHISMAFLNPGDSVLIPDPGYPTYASATKLCEARAIPYALTASNNWMPDFDALEQMDLEQVKLMWVNYPNMPTGAAANRPLFEKLVAFAREHKILIINDNPYSCVGYQNKTSIHQVPRSMEVALELNSISKTFNMAGWRVGMMVGPEHILKEVLKVKTNMDSGMFYGIQQGAIAALQTSLEWLEDQDKTYERRRNLMLQVAHALHLKPQEQKGGLFIWCALPNGKTDDKLFVDQLLQEHHIFIAPGSIFGMQGKGYVRFSLCVKEKDIISMLDRVASKNVVA